MIFETESCLSFLFSVTFLLKLLSVPHCSFGSSRDCVIAVVLVKVIATFLGFLVTHVASVCIRSV